MQTAGLHPLWAVLLARMLLDERLTPLALLLRAGTLTPALAAGGALIVLAALLTARG